MAKNKVAILLDGSEFSERILPAVQRFLRPEDNELTLFRVGRAVHGVHIHDGPLQVDIYDDQAEASATAELGDALQHDQQILEAAGYRVATEISFGKTVDEIDRFIKKADIDLVAMTTHERNGLSKILQGSVAEHVLHHAPIPILLLASPA
jgi:nucleotide-binding universal stress UspA family protein